MKPSLILLKKGFIFDEKRLTKNFVVTGIVDISWLGG
jgi:hypothetical protein